MPKPLSNDLRERIILAHVNENLSYKQLAARFCVGEASVKRLVWRWRETGSIAPTTEYVRGPAPLISDENLELVRQWLAEKPDMLIEEMIARLEKEVGVVVSQPTVSRALKLRLDMSRKKKPSSRPKGTDRA